MLRYLLFPIETLIYGISYGYLQFHIRAPKPLPAEPTWRALTTELPRGLRWIRNEWPLRPLRRLTVAAKMKQDHALGIAAHYDVSNDFYELFLDKRFMFYSCADFHSPEETLEEAQQHKADFTLNLIDPQPGEKILELGCGWGPMLQRIHQHTDDRKIYTASPSRKSKPNTTVSTTAFRSSSATSLRATTRRRSTTRFTRSVPGNTSDRMRSTNFWKSSTEHSNQVDASCNTSFVA